MKKIKAWYMGLSNQWKATLRSAWQAFVGAVGLFLLAVIAEAQDLVNGGTLAESLTDLSLAAKVLAAAILAIFTGLVTLVMNRQAASGGATYQTEAPDASPPPAG